VLIGTALYRVVHRGAEEIAAFHIDVPAALAEEVEPPFWARMVPGTPKSIWGGRRREPRGTISEREGGEPRHPTLSHQRRGPDATDGVP
jgi:hypothetical protein